MMQQKIVPLILVALIVAIGLFTQPSQAAPSPQLLRPDLNQNIRSPAARAFLRRLRISDAIAERITQASVQFAARIAARQAARALIDYY